MSSWFTGLHPQPWLLPHFFSSLNSIWSYFTHSHSSWWMESCLDCSHILATMNNASVNTPVKGIFFGGGRHMFLLLLHKHQWAELPDDVVTCLTIDEPPDCFPQWLHHFTSPLAMYEGWASSTSLPTLAVICLFDYSHPSGCEAESHCGFDLHFLHDGWCRGSFPVLTAMYLSSSENCLLSASACFWIGLFVFLLFCWVFVVLFCFFVV